MKKFLSVLLCGLILAGSTACSSGGGSSGAPAASSSQPSSAVASSSSQASASSAESKGETTELVFLNAHAEYWEADIGKQIIAGFEKENPGITVKTESYPFDQMFEIVEVKMKSKLSDFDVFEVDAPMVASYSVRGYLEPFENYVGKDVLEQTFTPLSLATASYNGKVMTAPQLESGMIMVYNKKILQENNIPLPSSDPKDRMTWEQLLEICQKVKRVENGATSVWGIIGDQINRVWNVMPMANSAGTLWLSEDGKTATGFLNSAESVKVMTFFQDLFNKYGVSPKGVNTNEARELFTSGKCAFTYGDPACLPRAQKAGVDCGVMPVPMFEGGRSAVGCDSWHEGINAYSQHKEAAAKFVEYTVVGEGNAMLCDWKSNIGAHIDRMEEVQKDTNPNHKVYQLLAYELKNSAFSRPKTPGYLEWQDVVNAAIEDIRNGAEVKSTLDNAASKVDSILKKYSK